MATTHLAPAQDHCLAPSRRADDPADGTRYGRMFPGLEPLEGDETLLRALGASGGACDGSPLAGSGDDAKGAAGWPFFGQFIAHDITADRSGLAEHADLAALRNARSPKLDLECIYGEGPAGAPFLYDRDDPPKLLLGGEDATDLLRNPQGIAIIGDPRNDVHVFVAQLHLALQKVHNRLVDRLRAQGVAEAELFGAARRETRWHYQWVVVNEFLPVVIGQQLVDELRAEGPRHYPTGGATFIPLEFADAAYRYGHSQIRHSYRLNASSPPAPLFPDLLGFAPIPSQRTIDWSCMFDTPGAAPAQRAKRIDGCLPAALIDLPAAIIGTEAVAEYHSLAVRDLERGQATGLPSGEAVARLLGAEPLTPGETGLAGHGWDAETPLWYYVLKESEARRDGELLGPVGGRIVGEVLLGIAQADPGGYLASRPDWRPSIPTADAGGFHLTDLLALAQAPAEAW